MFGLIAFLESFCLLVPVRYYRRSKTPPLGSIFYIIYACVRACVCVGGGCTTLLSYHITSVRNCDYEHMWRLSMNIVQFSSFNSATSSRRLWPVTEYFHYRSFFTGAILLRFTAPVTMFATVSGNFVLFIVTEFEVSFVVLNWGRQAVTWPRW